MFRALFEILFGGGVMGAFLGWMLIQFLDERRKNAQRVIAKVEAYRAAAAPTTVTNEPGAVIQLPPGVKPSDLPPTPSPSATAEAIMNDPQVVEWIAQQRERKIKLAMERLHELQRAEEERGKRESRGPF